MKNEIKQNIESLEMKNTQRLKHINQMHKAINEFASDENSITNEHFKKNISLLEDAIAKEKKEIEKLEKLLGVKELI